MKKSEHLERFLKNIYAQKDTEKQDKTYSLEELKAIALSTGISETEWNEFQEEFSKHLDRGTGYLRYNNYSDALKELEQAISINPYHTEALFQLAQAYVMQWNTENKESARQAALTYSQRCLEIDPKFEKAYKLISQLKNQQKIIKPQPVKKNTGIRALLIMGVIFGLGLAFFFIIKNIVTSSVNQVTEQVNKTISTPEKVDIKNATGKHQQLQHKLGIINTYIDCINRHSGRIYQSYNRYHSWLNNTQAPPTGNERIIYGLYDIYDTEKHLNELQSINKAALELGAIGVAGAEYTTALSNLVPMIEEAYEYYDMKDYQNDDFKKAKEMHAPLVYAFKKYIETDRKLRKEIQKIQEEVKPQILEIVNSNPEYELYAKNLEITDVASSIFKLIKTIPRDKLEDNTEFKKQTEIFEKKYKEIQTFAKYNKDKWHGSSFQLSYYKQFIKNYRDYIRNNKFRHRMGIFHPYNSYNRMISSVNSDFEVPDGLRYKLLTYPVTPEPPVE